jgi:hypothetical protein
MDTFRPSHGKKEDGLLRANNKERVRIMQKGDFLMRATLRNKVLQILMITCLLVSAQALAAEIKPDEFKSVVGTWSVEGDVIKNTDLSSANTNAYASVAQSGEVLTYEWTVKFNSTTFSLGPAAGMHILANEATSNNRGNSYLVFQDKEFIRLYRASGGSLPKVNDYATPVVSVGDKLTYKVVFNTKTGLMQIYRDGELIGTYTDPAPFKSGSYISLRTNGTAAEFSNIKVTQE